MPTMSAKMDECTALEPQTDATSSLLATQYGSWYPQHKPYTLKSKILNIEAIEPGFLEWLDQDGLVLSDANDVNPEDGDARPKIKRTLPLDPDAEIMSDPSDDEGNDTEDGAYFPALNAEIRRVLLEYDGAVFPKFNWSAPQDAAWIMPGHTLRCQTPNDVYLLLKSSDFAMKDLSQVRELSKACENEARPERPHLQLVLKKWFELPRSHEFRCFVRDGHIVGACQRDMTFYEHLQDAATQERIQSLLFTFYRDHLAHIVPRRIVFDVYLTRHLDTCFLMDLNPWLDRTDTLLWTGDELEHVAPSVGDHGSASGRLVPLRVLASQAEASQALPTYSAHMVPADVVELSHGQNVAEFAQQWTSHVQNAMQPSSEDECE